MLRMNQAQLAQIGVVLAGSPAFRDALLGMIDRQVPETLALLEGSAAARRSNPESRAAVDAGLALAQSMRLFSALVAATLPQCNLAAPPEDIEPKVDVSGDLIYRCYHTPPHEWNLNGQKRP